MYILIILESKGSDLRNAYSSGSDSHLLGTNTTNKKISALIGSLVVIVMLSSGFLSVVNSFAAPPSLTESYNYKGNTSGDNGSNKTLQTGQKNQQSFSIQPCDKTHPCVSSAGPT